MNPKPLLSPEQAKANEAARVAYKAYSEVQAKAEPLRLAWLKAEQHAYNMRHKA